MSTVIESPDPAARTLAAENEARHRGELLGETLTINMGPSHPATHGVLRIVLELDGEIITKADTDIGYLHRGDEKIAENMQYNQFVPYTDRLDYLAPLANNVAYALAVEKLMGLGIAAAGSGHPGDLLRAGPYFVAPPRHRGLRHGHRSDVRLSLHFQAP
jgi:NADH-quinone oxidoreductase subunit D